MHTIQVPDIIKIMRNRSTDLLKERASAIAFALESYAEKVTQPPHSPPQYIWQYWDGGLDNAPHLIQNCVQTIKNYAGTLQHIIIDDKNINDYINIPNFMKNKPINKTQFSDYLRTNLLYNHGGIWIDATVMLSQNIPNDILSADFFCFSRANDPFILSSWFISAEKHHPLMEAALNSLHKYYSVMNQPYHYFMYHFIFEAIISIYPSLHKKWLNKPFRSAYIPHIFQKNFDVAYDPIFFNALNQVSWIHKLTYKYETHTPYETIWDFLNSHNFAHHLEKTL